MSLNICFVTDNGTGDYGTNFTNNMNNALYCVTYGGTNDGDLICIWLYTSLMHTNI